MKLYIESFHWNGRSEYGNYYFFFLPFINWNGYEGYEYLSIGWLTVSLTIAHDSRKRPAVRESLPWDEDVPN